MILDDIRELIFLQNACENSIRLAAKFMILAAMVAIAVVVGYWVLTKAIL